MDGCSSLGHGILAFHAGYCETVLFDFWKVSGVGGLLGSMIAIFIMAVLYEFLKNYRLCVSWDTYRSCQCTAVAMPVRKAARQQSSLMEPMEEVSYRRPQTMFSRVHGFQTFLHVLQTVLSYFLMLIFMTYNVWFCVALVFGIGVGYFLFAWKTTCMVDACQGCQ
jgi:copper transporter 1